MSYSGHPFIRLRRSIINLMFWLLVFQILPIKREGAFGQAPDKEEYFSVGDPEKQRIARQEYAEGTKAFKEGRFQDAVQSFMRVYRIKPYPNLVYNMARAFEELKEYSDAADYYERYLTMKPDAKDRSEVELTISTLRRLIEKDKTHQPSGQKSQLKQRLGWGGVAAGGALFVGSVVFGVRAIQLNSDLRSLSKGDDLQAFESTERSRNSSALLSDIFTVSGSVLVGVGLFLALSSDQSEEMSQESARLGINFGPSSISVHGVF